MEKSCDVSLVTFFSNVITMTSNCFLSLISS